MNLLSIILKYGEKKFIDKEFTNENAFDKFIHKIHPKQIICKFNETPFMFYSVEYEYTTIRGNRKKGIKYFIFNTYSPQKDMQKELNEWIKEFNDKNPSRQLLNVKFLNSCCLGYIALK